LILFQICAVASLANEDLGFEKEMKKLHHHRRRHLHHQSAPDQSGFLG
jgi:hypothetical protein